MRANKSLGSRPMAALSPTRGVVDQKDGRERILEILALIGWMWILWYLFTQNVSALP